MCPKIINFILFFDIFYFFATLIAGSDVVLSNEDKLEFSGDFAIHGEFPFIVHLGVQKKKKKVTCTGVILTNQWILTAAHCLHTGYYKVPVKDIRVSIHSFFLITTICYSEFHISYRITTYVLYYNKELNNLCLLLFFFVITVNN